MVIWQYWNFSEIWYKATTLNLNNVQDDLKLCSEPSRKDYMEKSFYRQMFKNSLFTVCHSVCVLSSDIDEILSPDFGLRIVI